MKKYLWFALVFYFAALSVGAVETVEINSTFGGRIWVYLPGKNSGEASIPCVIVPPAGSRLFHGIRLTEGDRAEHLPYANRGFAVVSFDISGEVDDIENIELTREAISRFIAADCGVLDARRALEVAIKQFPEIDRSRVFIAGHSSAGTLALQIAASDPTIRGCVALAPIGDLRERFGSAGMKLLEEVSPGCSSKLVSNSPILLVEKIRCPVFLFHALDDENVAAPTVYRLKEAFESSGTSVEYLGAKSGGHYNSMIESGLPAAVNWLSSLDQEPKEKKKTQESTR
jgi:cephalosporin-C deacetylase-like acetyl esterase